MTPIVWLASYPKSGNTWMRVLLANLIADGDEPFPINALSRRRGIASSRALFEDYTLLDSGLLTEEEIDRLRPGVYRAWAADLAREKSGPFVVKCHDAYARLPDGTPLLGGAEAARGAIVIVRDPRDVALSLADQAGISIDESVRLMGDSSRTILRSVHGQRRQLSQRLLDWSGHISSWIDQRDLPVHVVRYEDMEADPVAALMRAADFVGLDVARDRAVKAARLSAFDRLRGQEATFGFAEAEKGRPFFRRGHSGGWRTALLSPQARRITVAHEKMMARLGYRVDDADLG